MKSLVMGLALGIITTSVVANNLPTNSQALNKEILDMDHKLFDVAFNQCKIELWQDIVSQDIEFYDDRTGLNTSYEKEVMAFKDKCSKPFSVTRKLVSTEVHPLGEYGALQTGKHNFYVDGNLVEKSQFITVWERLEDKWIVKRVVSYDHRAVEP